jgi:hypothetical protein
LEIKVKQPGMRVSARNGYYGEALGMRAASGTDRVTVSPERQKPQPPPPVRSKK